ncbi:RagB/SusD family nutrient uptake outer membrane protein [Chitinophaga sp. Cy-1792]|uniref:RagB/SusD family nutrient uptake outer membrane protein n=1 Tax=Chitinophaga sp. Cy-1792 TaxID=2608339 RepID=UPI00141F6C71|nr:RagB/SusD family nutrient uptake outer membrane protein [Chitinophaga sp. Cy-1792]NIG55113.1 RagB/SusD family nutrient uptake outer membrane protein [Chitinophaga sp. Cy-1792]
MRNYKLISTILLTTAILQSCGKYTDIKTEGALTPGDYLNYRYLMNNQEFIDRSIDMPDISADDQEYLDFTQQKALATQVMNAYMWGAQYYDINTADPDWKLLYASNYPCNLVIRDVMSSSGGNLKDKKQVLAEARVHRAYNYFTLVNEYGKQYDATTSNADLGVPLVLDPDVALIPTRTTVKAAYDNVIADLTAAIPDLPALNNYNIYPSQAAAYALLARVYLQMGNYEEAGKNAASALTIQNTLNDLPALTTYPVRLNNPEVILSKKAGSSHAWSVYLMLSKSLLALFDKKDSRYTLLTQDYVLNGVTYRMSSTEVLSGENRNLGPSVPEMMLIKAEGQARAGDAAGAMTTINTLRQKRFKAADYVALTASDKDDALVKVLQERRRELAFKCMRWFDQKRLAGDARFTSPVTRTNLLTNESYTLEPGSNRYVYPVPQYNIQLNPSLEQNPR